MLDIHYLESIGCENEYFCYIEEDCLDVFVEKIDEIFSDCGTFWEKKKLMSMISVEKEKYSAATLWLMWWKSW